MGCRSFIFFIDGVSSSALQPHEPIAQNTKGKAEDDACTEVCGKAHEVASLQHLYALIGKGGEGGETAAHTCGEQQAP